MKCEYGCGKEAKFQLKNKKWCCSKSCNSCEFLRKKNGDSVKKNYRKTKRNNKSIYQNLSQETKDKISWAKGLTKENNDSLNKISKTLSKKYKDGIIIPKFLGKRHSTESKEKISAARIKYLETHSNHGVNWYDIGGIKVQGTWEKTVGEWLISKNIKLQRIKLRYNGYRIYTPDFYIEQYNLYIEVKGFMKDRDKRKMWLVLDDNDIDLRIVDRDVYLNLTKYDILTLPVFSEKYKREDINFNNFIDVWENDENL